MQPIDLPDIEGLPVPSYVRQIASGKINRPKTTKSTPTVEQITKELESLTKSDSSLIQKYVGLYRQIRLLKEEVETFNQEASRLIRTEEERKKYAVRRTDIPAKSQRLSSSSVNSDSGTALTSSPSNDSFGSPKYSRHSTDTIPLRSGFNPAIPVSLTLRNDSVNSIHSSSSSRSSLPPSGNLGSPERIPKTERILKSPMKSPMFDDGKDFSEISMPEEGELSNLDVQWFLDYNTTLSRKSK